MTGMAYALGAILRRHTEIITEMAWTLYILQHYRMHHNLTQFGRDKMNFSKDM